MRIPKHYQLVKEHPHSFEMHDTRDKSQFHIAKDHIDEKMHAKIASVPKYADGGQVAMGPSRPVEYQNYLGKPVELQRKHDALWNQYLQRQNNGGIPDTGTNQYEEGILKDPNYQEFNKINKTDMGYGIDLPWNPNSRIIEKNSLLQEMQNPGYRSPVGNEIRSRGQPVLTNEMYDPALMNSLPTVNKVGLPIAPSRIEYLPNPEETVGPPIGPHRLQGPVEASVSPLHMPPNTVMAAEGGEIPETDNEADTSIGDEDRPVKYANMNTQQRMEALMRYTNPQISEQNKEETYTATEPDVAETPNPVQAPQIFKDTSQQIENAQTNEYNAIGQRNPASVGREPAFAAGLYKLKTAPKQDETGAVPVYPPAVTTTEDRGAVAVPTGAPQAPQAPAIGHTPTYQEALSAQSQGMLAPYEHQQKLIDEYIGQQRQLGEHISKGWNDYLDWYKSRPSVVDMVQDQTAKNQQFIDSMVQNKLNPNAYWDNMGTAGKVTSAIAMVLGGIGAATGGGENAAMTMINKAIDRDIEAQKFNQTNKVNLYNINNDNLKNKLAAELQTRQQMLGTVEAQMKAYTALAGGSEAAIKLAPMAMEVAKAQQQAKMLQALVGGSAPGTEDAHNRSRLYAQMTNPEVFKYMNETTIPGYGTTQKQLTDNDRKTFGEYNNMQALLDEARQFTKMKGTTLGPTQAAAKAAVLNGMLTTSMNGLTGINRLNEHELQIFDSMRGDVGAWFSGAQLAKIAAVQNILNQHKLEDYRAWGFMPFKRHSAQELMQAKQQQVNAQQQTQPAQAVPGAR